jgi:hypothetical protein
VEIACPTCHEYEAWRRHSINLTPGEERTEEDVRVRTHARWPECGLKAELETLVIKTERVWR